MRTASLFGSTSDKVEALGVMQNGPGCFHSISKNHMFAKKEPTPVARVCVCVGVCAHLLLESVGPYATAANIQHLNIQMAEHQSTQCFLPSPGSSLETGKEDKYSSSGRRGTERKAPAPHLQFHCDSEEVKI